MNEELFVHSLQKIFPAGKQVVLGIGDDCAALELPGMEQYLLAAVDQVVEGIHYLPGTPVEKIAGKLVRRNVSDIASMGGTPAFAMLSMALSSKKDLMKFHEAVQKECEKYGIQVIGGDLSGAVSGSVYSFSILGFAEREKMKTRSGVRAGDALYSCGAFGRSFSTGWHLDFEPQLSAGKILSRCPEVHAMMDVSDGLLKDSLRMAEASSLQLYLDFDAIPRRDSATLEEALFDGEDYALIFAASPEFVSPVNAVKIGEFSSGTPGRLLNKISINRKGFDHFEYE